MEKTPAVPPEIFLAVLFDDPGLVLTQNRII